MLRRVLPGVSVTAVGNHKRAIPAGFQLDEQETLPLGIQAGNRVLRSIEIFLHVRIGLHVYNLPKIDSRQQGTQNPRPFQTGKAVFVIARALKMTFADSMKMP